MNRHSRLCTRVEATGETCLLLADARLCSMHKVVWDQRDSSASDRTKIEAYRNGDASVWIDARIRRARDELTSIKVASCWLSRSEHSTLCA